MKPVCPQGSGTHASACRGAAVMTVDGNKRKRLPAIVAFLHARRGGICADGWSGAPECPDCVAQLAFDSLSCVFAVS